MSPSSTENEAVAITTRRLEVLVEELKVPAHVVAGVMVFRGWDVASQITKDELQAAIDEVASITIR